MTSGTLCMMVCPILEDELVHNLKEDADPKKIFLLTNDNTKHIIEKLHQNGLDYTPIGEQAFLNGNEKIPEGGYNVVIWMLSLGLHQEPANLKEEVRNDLKKIDGMVDGVMLYYGLCGRGLEGIEQWSAENVKMPVTIFKDKEGRLCDDCICVPLGSTDNYLKLLKKYPGVLYITPAMACDQDEFMSKMELFQGTDTKDYDMLRMLLDMAGYTRALKIQTGLGDQEHFQECAEEYAGKLGLKLELLADGWVSNEVADRTYAVAKGFLKK
jgi:hypothetical protein